MFFKVRRKDIDMKWFEITCKDCNKDCTITYDQQNEDDSISIFAICYDCNKTEDLFNIKLGDIVRF